MEEFITQNYQETQKIGEAFAKKLLPGDILALYGNLGAGKTTFVQGLALGLQIKKRIISPTFVIVRNYLFDKNTFYHVDLYRLHGEKDIESTGLPEILQNKNAIIAIEWSEKMGSLLPEKRWEVHIEHVEEDKRKIVIESRVTNHESRKK